MAPGTGQVSANGAPVRSSGLRVAWRPKSLARLASKTLSGEKGQCGQRLRVHPGNSSCNSLEVKTYKLKKKGGVVVPEVKAVVARRGGDTRREIPKVLHVIPRNPVAPGPPQTAVLFIHLFVHVLDIVRKRDSFWKGKQNTHISKGSMGS